MRKYLTRVVLSLVLICSLLMPVYTLAEAPGERFTATASCGNLEGSVAARSSNATIISADSWCNRGETVSATAQAGSVGTASVYFVTVDVTDVSNPSNPVQGSSGVNLGGKSVQVSNPSSQKPTIGGSSGSGNSGGSSGNQGSYQTPQVNQPQTPQGDPLETKSDNANLSSLTISKGTLAPAFSAEKTNYSVSLEKEDTSVRVEATAEDSKATVSGTGDISLKPGDNEITISVTAEDGTVKKYIIKAMVDESPDVYVDYNGKKLGVVKKVDEEVIPASFEKTMISLEGKNVEAWHSNLSNITIVYMIDDNNEKNFYLYDENTQMICSVYKPIALLGRNVAIIDIPAELQDRAGMKYGEVEVDTIKLMGWIFSDPSFENYVLLYLMDDKGQMHYYLYEKSENTLQLYSRQAPITQTQYEQLLDDLQSRMIMVLALAITNVVTLAVLLVVVFKKRKPKNKKQTKQKVQVRKEPEVSEVNAEEEVEPFDAWKYEAEQEKHTIHMKPYEQEQHLFEKRDEDMDE